MNITLINSTTTNELLTQAAWHRKQAQKLERKFEAEFARAEKHRANTCKDGTATYLLKQCADEYLSKFDRTKLVDINYYLIYRPSTETLLMNWTDSTALEFFTDKPFYNKYFASQWYKNNWEKIVTEWYKGFTK